MKFLNKYWWVLLIVGVLLVWWFFLKPKPTTTTTTTTTTTGNQGMTCPTTASEWNSLLQTWESNIRNDAAWLTTVQQQAQSEGWTEAEGVTRNAEFYIIETLGICKPA